MASKPQKPKATAPRDTETESAGRSKARNALRESRSRAAEPARTSARPVAQTVRSRGADTVQNSLRPTAAREIPQAATAPARATARSPRESMAAAPLDSKSPTSGTAARPKSRAKPDPAAVPEEVRSRFVQVGPKYFFADGTPAFTDRGRRLTTSSENTEVIRSLVLIAQVRGWNDVTLTGTERFRREAWFTASAIGLTVRGYRPTIFEQEKIARTLARRGASASPAPQKPGEAPRPAARSTESRLLVGRLVDYGRAPYKHDPHEPMSYFLKLETGRGERTLWGVDLERAFREAVSRPQLGDEVGVQARGQEPVVVKTAERDAEGRVVGQKPLDTHRNRWVVEKSGFFRTQTTAAETV